MLWDALGSFDTLESIRVTQVILGIKGLFLMYRDRTGRKCHNRHHVVRFRSM